MKLIDALHQDLGTPDIRESTVDDLAMFTDLLGMSMVSDYTGWLSPKECALRDYFWQEVRDPVSQSHYVEQLTPSDTRRAWVAEACGYVVGAITTELLPGGAVEVHKLHVLGYSYGPTYGKGRGTGSRLLREGIGYWGEERDFVLEVLHYNVKAIGFYERRGFAFDTPRKKIRYDGKCPAGSLREYYAYRMTRPGSSSESTGSLLGR
jgi:ribosomal protein S18 acetylase RimI-like enzyme